MESGTFDFAGLLKWGIGKGLGHLEHKTGLELQTLAEPIASHTIKSLALESTIVLGIPLTIAFSLIGAQFKKQKEIEEARRANAVPTS